MDGALPQVPAVPPSTESVASKSPTDFDRWTRILSRAQTKSDLDKAAYDRYVTRFREGHFTKDGENGHGASVNELYAFVCMLLASLYSQGPAREVEAREGGDPAAFGPVAQLFRSPDLARQAFAETVEAFLDAAAEDTELDLINNVCLQEGLLRGLGVVKLGFDAGRQMPRADALRRHEVYVDPVARYSLRQAQYIVQDCTMSIEKAREFFQSIGGPQTLEPNAARSDTKPLDTEGQKSSDEDRDQFRFAEAWIKDGDKRLVCYRALPLADKWLYQREWPYTLDRDEFPYQFLSFNAQHESVCDPFPELSIVENLDAMRQETMEYFRRNQLRSLGKLLLLDSQFFTEEDVTALMAGKALKPRLIDFKLRDPKTAYSLIEMNSQHDTSAEVSEVFKSARDAVLGVDELMRGAPTRKGMTATEAEIRDGEATLRLGRRQKILDNFLAAQCRALAQIGRQLVSPQRIAAMLGPKAGLLWATYNGSPEKFGREFDIGIAAGSTGERSRREKIQRLNDFMGAIVARNQRRMQMQLPPLWDEDELLLELARTTNLRRPERYQLEQAPAPQPVEPGPAAVPAGPQQAGAAQGPAPVPPQGPPQQPPQAVAPVAAPQGGVPA